MKAKIIFFVIPFLLPFSIISAQITNELAGPQTELLIAPEFPKPGEVANVSIANFTSQLYNSDIVWRYNGQVIGDANNKRSVDVITGDIGSTDVISVTLTRQNGFSQVYSAQIKPVYLDLVVEPQTRVPDFYQGRAVPSIGSQVNVTAVVNDGSLLDGNLRYLWRLNNRVLEGGPVRGSNQVSFAMPRGSRSTLSVEVADLNGVVLGRRAISLESIRPELEFYEVHPLYGQSHSAVSSNLLLSGSAATIKAEPYYLDINTYNNPDISEWEIDRAVQPTNNVNPYQIVIQATGEGQSTTPVSFHVRSTTELLQGAEKSFNVTF